MTGAHTIAVDEEKANREGPNPFPENTLLVAIGRVMCVDRCNRAVSSPGWRVDPGEFTISVGDSSENLSLTGAVTLPWSPYGLKGAGFRPHPSTGQVIRAVRRRDTPTVRA
jgi:hypothetical protein